jgi:hypothetical protein
MISNNLAGIRKSHCITISINKILSFLKDRGASNRLTDDKPERQHPLEISLAHSESSTGTLWRSHLPHGQGYRQLGRAPVQITEARQFDRVMCVVTAVVLVLWFILSVDKIFNFHGMFNIYGLK